MKDQTQQNQFQFFWNRGKRNLVRYLTEHHLLSHHHLMRKLYLKAVTHVQQ